MVNILNKRRVSELPPALHDLTSDGTLTVSDYLAGILPDIPGTLAPSTLTNNSESGASSQHQDILCCHHSLLQLLQLAGKVVTKY